MLYLKTHNKSTEKAVLNDSKGPPEWLEVDFDALSGFFVDMEARRPGEVKEHSGQIPGSTGRHL